MKVRIGNSIDIHRFKEGLPLVLGGVSIPHSKGLEGHSDADCVLHVVAESMLGALALGDLGKHFPDTDPAYKGISSLKLVLAVMHLVKQKNFRLGNIDITIVAESPILAPYINPMRLVIARLLEADIDAVSIKATRGEKMGFIGRGEGMLAQASVLLVNDEMEITKLDQKNASKNLAL